MQSDRETRHQKKKEMEKKKRGVGIQTRKSQDSHLEPGMERLTLF